MNLNWYNAHINGQSKITCCVARYNETMTAIYLPEVYDDAYLSFQKTDAVALIANCKLAKRLIILDNKVECVFQQTRLDDAFESIVDVQKIPYTLRDYNSTTWFTNVKTINIIQYIGHHNV